MIRCRFTTCLNTSTETRTCWSWAQMGCGTSFLMRRHSYLCGRRSGNSIQKIPWGLCPGTTRLFNLETSFNLTICKIIFGIPLDQNQTIKAIKFMIILGKWFINNCRSSDKSINFQNFLILWRTKFNQIIMRKNINYWDPQLWEIDMSISHNISFYVKLIFQYY